MGHGTMLVARTSVPVFWLLEAAEWALSQHKTQRGWAELAEATRSCWTRMDSLKVKPVIIGRPVWPIYVQAGAEGHMLVTANYS